MLMSMCVLVITRWDNILIGLSKQNNLELGDHMSRRNKLTKVAPVEKIQVMHVFAYVCRCIYVRLFACTYQRFIKQIFKDVYCRNLNAT